MSSFIVWAMLIISFLVLISSCLSIRNKNSDAYQSILFILILLASKVALYALEILSFGKPNLEYAFFTGKISLLPVIASLFLVFALASNKSMTGYKASKRILSLISFFFVGVILTNPIHNLAFTLTGENTIYELGYDAGMLLRIAHIYSGICFLIGFIVLSWLLFNNNIKTSKTITFLGATSAIVGYLLIFINSPYDIESIVSSIYMIIIYGFVFKVNDYNFIPLLKDNTFELLNDGILVVNNDLVIKDYNKRLTQLFDEIDFTSVVGKKLEDVFKFYPVVVYAGKNLESESITLNGKDYSIETYSSIEKHKKNSIHTISFKDDASIASSLKKLNDTATVDHLTQVKTKDYFMEMINFEFNKSLRYGLPFVILYIDIDNFSNLNQKYGHIAGDLILANIAKIIQKEIRKTDILARLEDDKFGLLLTHTNTNYCELVAERIRQKVHNNTLSYEGKIIKTTISIGISGSNAPSNSSIDIYLSKADEAIEKAKSNKKNCIVINLAN